MFDNRLIHRFWCGRPFPEQYLIYGQEWERLNPDHEVFLWQESSIYDHPINDDPGLKAVFDDLYARDNGRNGIELAVQLADVMGYALIERFGGSYFNTDMQPLRSLGNFPDSAWASYENHEDGRIVNAAIGSSEPHDPFWSQLLAELPENYFSRPGQEMIDQTGPAFLTDFARAHPELPLHVFPVETFNPVHWRQIALGGDAQGFEYPPESIAVHHWAHRKDRRTNTVENATQ